MRTEMAALIACAAAIVGIAVSQPGLAHQVKGVKLRGDVFLFPPPRELKASALGYDAAMADLLWTKLLLEYGTHWAERRYFRDARRFIDGITELEPRHQAIYRYCDTFLMYQPTESNVSTGSLEDLKDAIEYLKRGTRERADDSELWLHYGQFVAFSAPGFVESKEERDAFRREGAMAIAHAMDLGASPGRTSAAAAILGAAGETDAAVRYLDRAYALTEDEEERAKIQAQLARLRNTSFNVAAKRTLVERDRMWKSSFPFMTRSGFTTLGPFPDVTTCVGAASSSDAPCARDWGTLLGE